MHGKRAVIRQIQNTLITFLNQHNVKYQMNDKRRLGINIIIDKNDFNKYFNNIQDIISMLINDRWIYTAHIIMLDESYIIKLVYATYKEREEMKVIKQKDFISL